MTTEHADALTASRSRWRTVAWVSASTVLMMVATIAVYLIRATGTPESNWPVMYNLTSSDNGVLYQLVQDVFAGRALDWSFSPQTFTFPEIPISFIAFVVTAGNLYWYYIVVAALNVALLFLVLYLLVRYLYPAAALREHLLRALVAAAPLVLLPLFTINSIYLFQLAPTYYYGVYLLGLLLPIALLTEQAWLRYAVLAGYALAGASNPLLLAMTLPGVALVLLLTFMRHGWRGQAARLAMFTGATVLVSVLVRLLVLAPMVAADPTSYINATKALQRDREIYALFKNGFKLGLDGVLLAITVIALIGCALALLIALRRFFERPPTERHSEHRLATRIYLASMPFLGALAMYLIMAVHYYYLWFGVVGSIVIALLLWPRPRMVSWLALTMAALFVIGSTTTLVTNLNDPDRIEYFGARDPLTECLDSVVGERLGDHALGYSTFSDARHYSLTSQTGLRLIAVVPEMSPNFWLTNRTPAHHETGAFVLVNPNTSEPPLTPEGVTAAYGQPEAVVACGTDGVEIWFYDSEEARERIAGYLANWADYR